MTNFPFDIIRKVLSKQVVKDRNNASLISFEHKYFQNSFFHPLLLDRRSMEISAFKKQILKFIRATPNSKFNVHNFHGIN